MVKTLIKNKHRKYKKNVKGGKRTKRGSVIKNSRRMRNRLHKRYTRRHHMRNKRGGIWGPLQSSLLRKFKDNINSSSLRDLLVRFKKNKNGELDNEILNDINNDSSIVYDGEFKKFCEKLTDEEIVELFESIKNDSNEGKNFYRYVLLLILSNDRYKEAKSMLVKIFDYGQIGVPQYNLLTPVNKEFLKKLKQQDEYIPNSNMRDAKKNSDMFMRIETALVD